MATDPNDVLAAAQEFLQLYILGDSSGLHVPGQAVPAAIPGQPPPAGTVQRSDGTFVQVPVLPGIRRRRPAVQGEPSEFESFTRDPGSNLPPDDPTTTFIDMCGLEDFLLLPPDPADTSGATNTTLVLFWCTDYPASELNDLLPGLPATVTTVNVPSTIEANGVALELREKLEYLLGDDFASLQLQCQIEYLQFGEVAARKLEIAPPPPVPAPAP
jgi:hypothetical protein